MVKSKKSEKIKVLCDSCKRHTNHVVLYSKKISGEVEEAAINFWGEYQVIQCCGCDDITFRETHGNTENYDPYTGICEDSEILYPNRADGRHMMESNHLFPIKTRKIYLETLKALNNNAFILTAIGLRAIIESVCIENKIDGKYLKEKIDGLSSTGLLSKKQAEFLHEHRFMGNDAAHEMISPKATELVAAFDIVETLLKTIYILPEAATVIKTRKRE